LADPFAAQGKLKFGHYGKQERWHESQRYKF
jgi:hypothetical protein